MWKESTGETMAFACRPANVKRNQATMAVLLALALTACNGGGGSAPQPTLQSVAIGTGRAFATVGTPQQLTVTGQYSDGTTASLASGVTWSSSDVNVATVDSTGLVIPWTKGVAQITATHGASGLSAKVDLTSRVVVAVTAGSALPRSDKVDTTTVYFHVSGLSPGTMYTPTLSNMTDDVDIAVYSDVSMTSDVELCSSDAVGTVPESCVAPANASGDLWVAVDGEWTRDGAEFSFDVPVTQPVQLAGTLIYPAQLPYSGSVGAAKQFYKVTGLTPGANYEVRIANLTADIDVDVYGDPYEYASLCDSYQSGTVDDFCTARSDAAGELFIEIDGETTRTGGNYTLSLTPK